MQLKEYQKLAQRTLSANFFVDDPMPPLLHASIGFVTETTELLEAFSNNIDIDKVNVCEEIGDILWYSAIYCEYAEVDIDKLYSEPQRMRGIIEAQSCVILAVLSAGKFQDVFKKAIYYKKPLDYAALNVFISDLLGACENIAHWCNSSLAIIAETNIKKLQARYPEKFTDEKAESRDLEKEREILENTGC